MVPWGRKKSKGDAAEIAQAAASSAEADAEWAELKAGLLSGANEAAGHAGEESQDLCMLLGP
jgi:hypothetical protein